MLEKEIGRLIVFEGIDHVGKSTLAKETYERLLKQGVKCSHYSYPGQIPMSLGKLVYDIQHDKNTSLDYPIDPLSRQMLHIAAHVDQLNKRIIPDINNGKIVILDRFWWSTLAYGLGDGLCRDALEEIIIPEKRVLKQIDRISYFYVTKDNIEGDFAEQKTKKIIEAYNQLCESINDNSLVCIQNTRTIDDAVNKIITVIKEKNI